MAKVKEIAKELELPTKKEVCWGCGGEGYRVNPSIDGNGLSPDCFAENPDFAEDYFDGAYDTRCETCDGHRVVDAIDRENCSAEQLQDYEEYQRNERESREMYEAEKRMGC